MSKVQKLVNKYLILEALRNVKNEYELLLIKNLSYDLLSPGDVSFLNQVAYGDMFGVDVELVKVKKSVISYSEQRLALIHDLSSRYAY